MEVRIRSISDTESRLLAEIPFRKDAIDSIIPTIGAWGLIGSDGTIRDEGEIMGQFVDDGTKAFFEIVVGE